MSMHEATRSSRRPRMRRLVGGLLGAGVLALAAAAPASAALTSVSPSPVVNGSGITVSGTAPSTTGITQYTLAICNTTVALGTACAHVAGSYTAPTAISPGGTISNTAITNARKVFANYDFTTQSAGSGTTSCLGSSGVQCAVVASYYNASMVPVGPPDVLNITFS